VPADDEAFTKWYAILRKVAVITDEAYFLRPECRHLRQHYPSVKGAAAAIHIREQKGNQHRIGETTFSSSTDLGEASKRPPYSPQDNGFASMSNTPIVKHRS
jgi:hypothetical protein